MFPACCALHFIHTWLQGHPTSIIFENWGSRFSSRTQLWIGNANKLENGKSRQTDRVKGVCLSTKYQPKSPSTPTKPLPGSHPCISFPSVSYQQMSRHPLFNKTCFTNTFCEKDSMQIENYWDNCVSDHSIELQYATLSALVTFSLNTLSPFHWHPPGSMKFELPMSDVLPMPIFLQRMITFMLTVVYIVIKPRVWRD